MSDTSSLPLSEVVSPDTSSLSLSRVLEFRLFGSDAVFSGSEDPPSVAFRVDWRGPVLPRKRDFVVFDPIPTSRFEVMKVIFWPEGTISVECRPDPDDAFGGYQLSELLRIVVVYPEYFKSVDLPEPEDE